MSTKTMIGVIERIERDGFGIVRETATDRAAFFTSQSVKALPGGRQLRKGAKVSFKVDDAADKAEVMRVISLEPVAAS